MNKRIRRYAFLALLAAGLSSCAGEDFWDTFDRTIDGPIDFTVGIESSPAQRNITRATDEYSMANGTQVLLKVDGTWNKLNPAAVSKTAICTTSDAALSYVDGQTLYWDDYGAGDPNNSTNTTNGLSVLGVAVDGNTTAPTVNDWTSLPWSTVDENGNAEVNTKSKLSKDIIVSKNLTAYKFADRNIAGKLQFNHLLSKITINISAGDGFLVDGKFKFTNEPVLTLTNAESLDKVDDAVSHYAITNGSINVSSATATAATDGKGKLIASTISSDGAKVVKEALVYPGTEFAENKVIAQLNIDGNIYYIKSGQIRAAMLAENSGTDYTTKAGYNYIINIFVKKSNVDITASVTNWTDVNSEEVNPVINVKTVVGDNKGNITPSEFTAFNFYRREDSEASFLNAGEVTGTPDGKTNWTFTNKLFWTHHSQHYHFRGVFPKTVSVSDDTYDKQAVAVQNGEYKKDEFPCNFMLGMPEFSGNNYMCDNEDHTHVDMRLHGICARTSAINLNFRYMMSQVEVNLTSTAVGKDDHVDLSKTKVELVNVGNEGHVLLSDRSAVITDGGKETFELPSVNNSSTNYLGVIIPQTLVNTDKSNKVKFKITVFDDVANTYDVYYADVAPIKVTVSGESTAKETDKWESGVHYVYNLKITKTEIKATATLTDWTTVEAAEDVWF